VIPVLDHREQVFLAVHLVADHPWQRLLTKAKNGWLPKPSSQDVSIGCGV
jgi:hypothetical protein